jgi:hypothetical protein
MSVAELSAYLPAPVGVVRVLVGDAIGRGLILVLRDELDPIDDTPCMYLLRRVHEGLLRLA